MKTKSIPAWPNHSPYTSIPYLKLISIFFRFIYSINFGTSLPSDKYIIQYVFHILGISMKPFKSVEILEPTQKRLVTHKPDSIGFVLLK